MSIEGMQTAIARMIRMQGAPTDEVLDWLVRDLDLTEHECQSLAELGLDAELAKYGAELSWQRWETVEKNLLRLPMFVGPLTLHEIYLDTYEAKAMTYESDGDGRAQFTIGFLDHLLTDSEARGRIAEAAPGFIFDVIRFEQAEVSLAALRPPECPWIVLDLDYDVPAVLSSTNLSSVGRQMRILLVRVGPGAEPRMFEIEPGADVKAAVASLEGVLS